MSIRRIVPWLFLPLAALAVGAILLATFLTNRDPPRVVGSEAVAATPSISPQSHGFGDRVDATLEVVVNRNLVDPDLVGVEARFPPYRLLSAPIVTRQNAEGITTIDYVFPLQCIDRECVALAGEPFAFPEARVNFLTRDENRRRSVLVSWPTFSVASRVTSEDLNRSVFRVSTTELSNVSYRISPAVLGWLLIAIAAAIIILVAFILFRWLRPESPKVVPAPEPADSKLSRLEEALALVEEAANGDTEKRRVALDRLARALEGENLTEIAPEARRLAWSATNPKPEVIDELLTTVRRAREVTA